MKVCLSPSPSTAPTDNGIGRVLYAMGKYLPAYGVELTEDPQSADVVAFHAGTALGKRVDCLHAHGLYWSDLTHSEFSRSNNVANQRIIDAARRAKFITVPSDWVAEPFRRDMRINPTVIGHGIDVAEWKAGAQNNGYVLWNKNRPTDVCDPTPAWELARRGLPVVSTFGLPGKLVGNMRVIGQMPYDQMKEIIEGANLYLATTPETFGIGTLEAMVCGVPILGYDWCGTRDLVRHKETGWLVKPGDIDGLVEGAAWLKEHRKEVGANAREFALGFDWQKIIGQYYELYVQAAKPEPRGVSVVITNHNYGNWVADAIKSVQMQTVKADEIIVVDDGSTDDSLKVLTLYAERGEIRLIAQENQGVAAARNNGIAAAKYPLIVSLDADDMIAENYIAALRPPLERDRGLGVSYCGVKFIKPDGRDSGYSTFKPFSWEVQARRDVPPPTCIPSGSMFRKSMWERNGGYKQKYAPGEDTEFWTHGLSLGFTAEMATPECLFWYRGHEGSESRTKKYVAIDDNKPWLQDRMYPMGAPALIVPNVRSYLNPVISVIIPVGPGHESLISDAVESVIGQSVREWEVILIDDTGGKGDFKESTLKRYPFIRWFTTKGRTGAGFARNVGIEAARGGYVLFLDADDWLRQDAMDLLLQATTVTGLYSYPDFYIVDGKEVTAKSVFPYDRAMFQLEQVMHSVTALVPVEWALAVGGFDEDLPGWEEYDFYMKLAVAGYCGTCVKQPLFYYRLNSGTRRQISQGMKKKLNSGFAKKFGGVEMAKCCGGGGAAILDAKRALGLIPREATNIQDLPNEVRLEFTGVWLGPVGFTVNGRTYYGAQDDLHRFINAPREDVDGLTRTGKWRVLTAPPVSQVIPEMTQPIAVAAGEISNSIPPSRRRRGG
jgi:glycosyltransferase involved in cell wall biosynthesis